MLKHKPIIHLAQFLPKKELGKLFAQAKLHNQINTQLKIMLPSELDGVTLCLIADKVVTLIANNTATAFRAQQQQQQILNIMKQITALNLITRIEIKIAIDK